MMDLKPNYLVPIAFVGIAVATSVFIYQRRKHNAKSGATSSSHSQPSSVSSLFSFFASALNPRGHNYSSSSNAAFSSSSSLMERSTSIPNQKYRKQDPETKYDDDGTRYQCCSIPYRITADNKVEIFMITSRNKGDYIFPGGGWEKNESAADAALREAYEEAGVRGVIVQEIVSDQKYVSDKGNRSRLWGFLLKVHKIETEWPEPERRRKWMSIDEAEIALPQKRRAKFGDMWTNGINYFIEQNLYRPQASSTSHNSKSSKNGYHRDRSHRTQINVRTSSEDKKCTDSLQETKSAS
mmetsp:Transcript_4455/g.7449  ORF Transcript_4455/g.7449 Transcript_4455/m.7449 type:complete len:296 (-) Transcript_4455:159-1046(-)